MQQWYTKGTVAKYPQQSPFRLSKNPVLLQSLIILFHKLIFRYRPVKALYMCIEPLDHILMYFLNKGVRRAFLFYKHILKLLDRGLERFMLRLMLLVPRIVNILLKLLLCGEMEIRVVRKIIHHLDRGSLLIALLTAVQQLVDTVDQFLMV